MNRKALFFDIDGTLFSEIDRQVPQSAALALKKARERGHLVFINTGRTYSQTKDIREAVEADGYLCGCGTCLYVNGEVLYNRTIPKEQRAEIKRGIAKYGLECILEGVNGCSLRDDKPMSDWAKRLQQFMISEGAYVREGWEQDNFEFSKFCIKAGENSERDIFFSELKGFHVIDRGDDFFECVPDGHSKATAIEFVLKKYGMAKKDAWVFGDSMNDLAMFQYSENAVLMGKHDAGLEPYATFLAKTVEEDGIACALQELGII